MPFIKNLNTDFVIKDNQIVLSREYLEKNAWRFKKITGTRFAAVLGLNKYSSPVQTWASIVGIYKEEMDPVLAKVGNIIEPKIRAFVNQKTNNNFQSHDLKKIGYDAFKDPVYGGVPDGEIFNDLDPKDKTILEIKTTSIDKFQYGMKDNQMYLKFDEQGLPVVKLKGGKQKEWFDQNDNIVVPNEYICQLSLYLHLRHMHKGLFAIAFLEKEDYKDPELFDPNKRQIVLVDMDLNDNEQFNQAIEFGRKWHEQYVKTGISPKLTIKDVDWLKSELKLNG
ncbi:MAG: YqaJ viral recombinase family protein [Mycoplasma sp.]